ncbi:MAG TPA: DUF3108 domain-containing protein [Verrucomicrobiae bacterium]|nr:DUF3108 domain-containing protein [Verrucomicrobiae bacterium]
MHSIFKTKRTKIPAAFAVLASLVFPPAHSLPATAARQAARRKPLGTTQPSLSKDAAVPFQAGETLNYSVAWSAFTYAATAQLKVAERRNFFGTPAWHFQAFVHTENTVRSLFTVDDQFDSYTSATNLDGLQYELHLNELGRKVDHVYRLRPLGEKPPSPAGSVIVPRGTRDPLGAFYSLRAVDWQKTPEVAASVYDGHDVYEMHAVLDAASEDVAVPAGRFSASRISVTPLQNHVLVPGIQFTIWIARNAERTPVQIVAVLPFGTLHIVLTSVTP